MNTTETSKLRVEIDGDDAAQTFVALQTEAKEINKELRRMKESGEEGSEAWKELKLRQKDINEELREMKKNIDINDASMAELTFRSRQLNSELNGLKTGSEEWIAKMKEVAEVENRISEVREEMKRLKGEGDEQTSFWGTFKGHLAAAFTYDAIMEAGRAVFEFGKEVVETGAKFEKYQNVLNTTLGDTQKGAEAFEMLQDVAAKTNFSLDEMTDSYIKMANRGLRPGQEELIKLADVANTSSKPMGDLVEAINDVNNTDRWNEFGIKAQTNGDKVSLTFKGVTQEVERSEAGVLGAITAFGEMNGVMGMTATISQGTEGQLANMGDKLDSLYAGIFNKGKDGFNGLISWISSLIEVLVDVVKFSDPVVQVFDSVVDVVGSTFRSIGQLVGSLFGLNSESITTQKVMEGIGYVFNAILTPIRLALTAVQVFVDGLNALQNKGKEVLNFFGADFKLDPKASFDTLAKNAQANFKSIEDSWKKTETGREAQSKATNKKIEDDTVKSGKTVSAEAKKEAEKRAKEHQKAEADSLKKIEDMKVAAIKSEVEREVAKEDLRYKREVEAVKKSVASQKTKNEQLALLETDHQRRVEKIQADAQKKQDQLLDRWLEDEYVKKIKKAQAFANGELEIARKTITDKEKLAQVEKQIQEYLAKEIKAIKDGQAADEEKARAKKAREEQQQRDNALKAEKQLFDSQFKEAAANADLNLSLAKDNADKIFKAKLDRLDAELKYTKQKLENEAQAEKEKNKALIEDADKRAEADKAIDARLLAQKSAADAKYQQDKTALDKEHLDKRKANADQFFNAINGLMTGDYNGFMDFLNKKLANDAAANNQRLQDFAQKGQETLGIASQVVGTLNNINDQYTQRQLARIAKERDETIAAKQEEIAKIEAFEKDYEVQKLALTKEYSEARTDEERAETQKKLQNLENEYNSRLDAKEQLEDAIDGVRKESDAREKNAKLQAFNREKTLNIAAALINAAQASLKSLATLGFPLGLVGVAASAVLAGIQIGIIKNQKPPSYKQGGYVRNAGVPQGPGHGRQYGQSGISLTRRDTGEEVGEMEGDEPIMILSRNTYKNNRPVIDRLLHSSLHRNGAPIYGNGGISDGGSYRDYLEPLGYGKSYLFGSRKAKKQAKEAEAEAKRMAAEQEAEMAKMQAEMDALANQSYDAGSYDTGGLPSDGISVPGADGDMSGTISTANSEISKSQNMMMDIADNTGMTVDALGELQAFMADTLLPTLKQQNDALATSLTGKIDELITVERTANGYLDRIAAKDLSVQTFVNVMNQINVVAGDSDLK
ncbi:hypothetical protein LX87_04080 [Larkinella arboricola]|uniref:Chromosome segregation ATPase n=1 Tax=Larkinella arboricola TaxID=643671 RepID=A0A327WXF5_LARAB|nr:hypothetical protein [Larkinella arboricola]RAJ94195.1 hypothetical protein LX87_04080 [Larkinella arboricola]